jgi:hypothetical protein
VVDALFAGDTSDVERASRRLGYEIEQNHRAVVLWSEDTGERLDTALATLERAALQLLGSLGATAPLVVPRARLCVGGWMGSRGAGETMTLDSA